MTGLIERQTVIEVMDCLEKCKKEIGYKGCRNCAHQIEPMRACKWLERGGDGVFHLICPRWERRSNE